MDLQHTFNSIGNAASGVLSGINSGVNNISSAIGNAVSSWGKGLNDEWQNARQNASQVPQDISNTFSPQNMTQDLANVQQAMGIPSNTNLRQQITSGQLPQTVHDSLVAMTNQLAGIAPNLSPGQNIVPQIAGETLGTMGQGMTQAATSKYQNKPMIEHIGDYASGIGAFMPEKTIPMAAVSVPFTEGINAIQSLGNGQMPQTPTTQDLVNLYKQNLDYSQKFAPAAAVASVPLNPVLSKIAPKGVTGLPGWAQRTIASGLGGAATMGVTGGLLPASSLQERMQNIGTGAVQGGGFGLVGGALSKPSLPALSEAYSANKPQINPGQTFTSDNGIKYTSEALDAYEKLVPRIAQQQQEFTIDPDNAMAKMLPQETYDQWYKAQPMNHSEGGNTVLKDARGYFGYINPQDVPQHAEDATNIMDHHVFDQLTKNNGYPELAVVRQTYDTNGNPNPLDITDGHHRFPIGNDIGMQNIPAVILDDSKPLLRDQFNQIKGIQDMTIGQMQPTQQGLVNPYSGGAEANLAFLKQPGEENAQAGFLNAGANANPLEPRKTLGQMQMERQRAEGLGALADLDQSIKDKNTTGIKQALHEILTAPESSPLAQYKKSVLNYGSSSELANLDDVRSSELLAQKNLLGVENLTDTEQNLLNSLYINKMKELASPQAGFLNLGAHVGGEENVRNLKTPQGKMPSDIGDQENPLGNAPVMAAQGNVLAGMKTLNQMHPVPEVPAGEAQSNQDLAMQQLRPHAVSPENALKALTAIKQGLDIRDPNNTFTNPQMGMQQLNQLRLQQNPDFYGTQANAPTDGSARPPAELAQALQMKSDVQDNLTNAKLLQDNYEQYQLQARQSGQQIASKAQLTKYVKTLQKNADALDSRVKVLQPDDPLLQNQIQASQDAPQAMRIAQDAATQNGAQVTARIKSVESQADQMDRKGKSPTQINDNLGFRVVAPTQAQADMALEQIKANPLVKVVKQEQVTDSNTGYAANHLDVRIGDSPQTIEYQGMTNDMAKLSQDTHDQYKVLDNPPTRVQLRQLTQLGYQPDQLSKLSQDDAKGIIKDKIAPQDHPTANEPVSATIPPASGTATLDDAVSARFGTMQNIQQRSQSLMPMITDAIRTPVETEAFRQAVEHPEQIGTLAQQAHDPNKFITAVNQFNQFNDYVHKTAQQSGLGIGYVKDYYSHILDLSDKEMKDKFNDLMRQRATNYKGYFTKSRIFTNIDDLRQQGFQLKNPNVPLDLQEYARAAQLAISNSAFLQKLAAYKPNDVKPISKAGLPVDEKGRSFVGSQIPGLSDTAFSQDLNNELKSKIGNSLEPGTIEGMAKYYDKANAVMKQIELSGGGFHILNTAPNYLADQLMAGHFPGVAKAAQVFLSPRAMNAYRQQAVTDGTLDKASAMNVTLSKAPDISTDALGNLDTGKTLNPIKLLNQGIFGRLMDYFKLETVRNAHVDLTTPKGIADARNIGAQVNNMFGGQNRAVGDSIFKSKGAQAAARALFLAPDYQEGRIGNALSAAKGVIPGLSDVGSRYAAKELMGRMLVTAGIAEAARRIVSGNFDSNVKDMFHHAFLDPQTPLPFTANPNAQQIATAQQNGTPPQGNPLIGRFPSSEPADMYRAWNDPVHFGLSHLGALPSTILSAATGKDYYGQDLVDPYAPKQGAFGNALTTAQTLAQSKLPIPGVQLAKLAQGKVNIPTAITNTLGIRVAQNPDNPGVVYETTRQQYTKDLTPDQKNLFDYLNPSKTNPYTGQPITDPTLQQAELNKPAKAVALLKGENISGQNMMKIQGDFEKQVAAKNGQQYDPIYDLTAAQQHDVNLMRSFLPGQSSTEKKAIIARDKDWYPDFQVKENEYYGSLPIDKQVSYLPTTLASPTTQKLLDQYNALPTGTGAKTAFSQLHPEISQYFTEYNNAITQEQMNLGLIPTASSTSGGSSRSSAYSSNYDQQYLDRALLRQSLLMKTPVTKFVPVSKLFLEPGQSPTSQGILRIAPTQLAKKPVTAIRYGGNQAPQFSRATVQYQRPRFVQNLKSMGGIS